MKLADKYPSVLSLMAVQLFSGYACDIKVADLQLQSADGKVDLGLFPHLFSYGNPDTDGFTVEDCTQNRIDSVRIVLDGMSICENATP
jgi:hypothetical protein